MLHGPVTELTEREGGKIELAIEKYKCLAPSDYA